MNKFDFTKLTPFKWFVLENFPFIEADFDALTEWQLFCKLGKEINKIIDSTNLSGEQIQTLTDAFNSLQNYVNNYLDNLDVQTEVNKKLNEMVVDGTIKKIINQDIFNELDSKVDNNTNNISKLNDKLNRENYITQKRSIHISFDDTTYCFQHLIDNIYNNLFDEPFFGKLKELHETYGACFSLLVFTDVFNSVKSTKYIKDFQDNCSWLKIGFHATTGDDNITSRKKINDFISEYNDFIDSVDRICGTREIVDRIPRLNNNACTREIGSMFQTTKCPIIGLLGPGSKVNRLWLTTYMTESLYNNDFYFDNITGLYIFRTQLWMENVDNVTNALNEIYKTSAANIECFTHESVVYHKTGDFNIANLNKLITICKFATDHNIPFNFLQNKYLPQFQKIYYFGNNTVITLNKNESKYESQFPLIVNQNDFTQYKHNMLFTNNGLIPTQKNNHHLFLYGGIYSKNCKSINFSNLATRIKDNLQISLTQFRSYCMTLNSNNVNDKLINWQDITNGTSLSIDSDTILLNWCFRKKDDTELTDQDIIDIKQANINFVY